jgi:hypothetical protein
MDAMLARAKYFQQLEADWCGQGPMTLIVRPEN